MSVVDCYVVYSLLGSIVLAGHCAGYSYGVVWGLILWVIGIRNAICLRLYFVVAVAAPITAD